ncbi:receptor-like protein EIX1 [Nicotiana tomentosiformis]|uniref:receptor-like protein EIX1 n=1 Tax=Nicotiana tomentosiformis TaxID=4098 RepID=UPI00051C5DBB|nr:receptor-like protein EIX1 [Nicotiana tomentosiformis]XP_018633836.1 receptor-like protein EIX1 [Nicotiana tomentosiformis]
MKSDRFLFLNIAFIGLVIGTSSGGDARTTLCIEREREALLKFKEGLIDNHGILSSWGREEEKEECCGWKGVQCSNITGHVVVLDIPAPSYSQALRGNITPSLLELQHLKHLDLSYNNFGRSRIPNFIGSFPRLEYLFLEYANLSGEIPHALGNLTRLQILDLSMNYNLVVKSLEWLPRLPFLLDLDLSGIHIETVNWLQQITKSPSLEQLNLKGCNVPEPIISISHLSSNVSSRLLSSLNLADTGLSSSAFRWLFNLSTRFTSIDLSSNHLAGRIPEAFRYMQHLEFIDLATNILEGGLPKSFGNLSHLRALDLSTNNLNQPLPELFLSLSGKAEKSLEELHLSNNHLSGSLPDITRFSSLKSLYLQENQLNGSFLESYGQTSKIEFLDLSNNQITGPLPNLTAFSAMREFHLNNNQFKGRLPQSIGQLSKLEMLRVESNFMEGPITESHLSNLSSLRVLDLSYNSFSFQLGLNWLPPFELDVISLSHCKMGPHFPQWLRTQKNYSHLDISFAGISGVAPNWFWDLSPEMMHFSISNNQISGEVPDLASKFVEETNYPTMDFSSNNFSGLVPSFSSNLESLNLSKNKFVGSISFLCKIANALFRTIDLSNNLLSGELHNCLMGFEELAILNLANNNLYGKIPSSIGFLMDIQSLQLRNNNFTGDLPTSLKNCAILQILDVGGNKLSGEIPLWIGSHLTFLVVLSLRLNKFNGSIPQNLCHLNKTHILDLSQNSLSGEIPRCLNNITSLLQNNNSSNPSMLFELGGDSYNGYSYLEEYLGDALVQWKSSESVYNKTLGLLKIIDFSNNELAGNVPEEIAQLDGVLSLNLSRNNLTGNVIQGIGKMEKLESLDLSRNQLTGRIPTSLAQLHFLSVLDLSSNNLSGKIPSSTQLQSFDPSSYEGNNELCGLPLAECPEDRDIQSPFVDHSKINNLDKDDKILSFGFYVCVASGFILGFWGVIFTLVLKQSFRDAYFQKLTNVANWIFVTTIMSLHRLKMLWS